MKLLLLSFIFPLILNSYAWADAGSMGSGGGMVVDCNGSIELLDVFEAKKNIKLKIMPSSENTLDDYITIYVNKARLQNQLNAGNEEWWKRHFHEKFYKVKKLINWHTSTEELPSTGDVGKTYGVPNNCTIRQVAIFTDKKHHMIIDKNLWNRMSHLSRAALLGHEEFYFYQRQLGDTTSENTRSYVGQVIANAGSIPVLDGKDEYSYFCRARNGSLPVIGKTDFYLNIKEVIWGDMFLGSTLEFQFTHLLGNDLLVRSRASMAKLPVKLDIDIYGLSLREGESVKKRVYLDTVHSHSHSQSLYVEFKMMKGQPAVITFYKGDEELGTVDVRNCSHR